MFGETDYSYSQLAYERALKLHMETFKHRGQVMSNSVGDTTDPMIDLKVSSGGHLVMGLYAGNIQSGISRNKLGSQLVVSPEEKD